MGEAAPALVLATAASAARGRRMVDRLSPLERACVRATHDGLTNREIAAQLGITEHTVRHHFTRAYEKLGVLGHGSPRTAAAVLLFCHEQHTHAGKLLRMGEDYSI